VIIGYTYLDKNGKELPIQPVKKGTASITTFYANGNKALEMGWKNNTYDGTYKLYYTDGTLAEIRHYKNGDKHGEQKRWNNDGSIQLEANFDAGYNVGIENNYNNKGKLISSYNYINGIRHGSAMITTKEGTKLKLNYYYGDLQ